MPDHPSDQTAPTADREPPSPEEAQCVCGDPLDEDGFCPQEESWV